MNFDDLENLRRRVEDTALLLAARELKELDSTPESEQLKVLSEAACLAMSVEFDEVMRRAKCIAELAAADVAHAKESA